MNGVELEDGEVLPADCVVVGAGVLPNTRFVEGLSLEPWSRPRGDETSLGRLGKKDTSQQKTSWNTKKHKTNNISKDDQGLSGITMKNWWFQEISTVTFFSVFQVNDRHLGAGLISGDLTRPKFGAPNFGSFQKGKWNPFVSGRWNPGCPVKYYSIWLSIYIYIYILRQPCSDSIVFTRLTSNLFR